MAHIKVVRRSMQSGEWNTLRIRALKKHIYKSKFEITNLMIKDARQVSEMHFEFYPGDWRRLSRGDLYFTPDGTVFIKADVDLPQELYGQTLWLSLKTAAEICVKINGKFVGGVDPNRERMLISPYIGAAKTLHIEMMGYNRSKPDDERNPESLSVRGCRQVFEGAFLCVVHDEVQDLLWDFEALNDIAGSELFSEDYREFLDREISRALDFIDFEAFSAEDVKRAKQYVDEVIYADKSHRGSGAVALVAHSHLDIAYYWRRIHSVQKNLRTVLIQLRLMDMYPDFKYTHTQPYLYETLEKYYPDVFREVQEKVASGQFEPVGGMYVEPDCNLPNAESLIRQCLYGQLTYKRMFGKTVNSAWLPDVFGNSAILPQILKKSGMDYFVSNKMSTWNDTNRFPHNNFIWQGLDKSRVLACVPPTHFITWNMPSQVQENWNAYLDKNSGAQSMNMFGYGDGGSGCTQDMLEMMKRFDKLAVMPECTHMGAGEYLEKNLKNNDNLQVWDGELYLEMHRGTFTTKGFLKRENRRLEYKFRNAEIVSVLKKLDTRVQITALYKTFLVNQFHDILTGSHINPVYQDSVADYSEIDKKLSNIIGNRGQYFNTLNFRRTLLTFFENSRGTSTRFGKRGYWALPNIPALSSVYIKHSKAAAVQWFEIGDTVETPFYSVKFAPDGSFDSLYDKAFDTQWVAGAFNKIKLYKDYPGNYDAWDILPDYAKNEAELKVIKPLEFLEADGECVSFAAQLGTEKSSWQLIVRLFKQSRVIEVENNVSWHEKHRLAKAVFSCNVITRKALCDTTAGFIERNTHKNTSWQQARFEVCQHNWCDLSETAFGVAIINDSKYGVGFDESTVLLSLLRSSVRPDVVSDEGEHSFSYLIYPHRGGAVSAGVNQIALEYNVPLERCSVTYTGDTYAPLFLQAMKESEDGSMIVIRLSEQDGARGKIKLSGSVHILNMLEEKLGTTDVLEYKPFEIITIGIDK